MSVAEKDLVLVIDDCQDNLLLLELILLENGYRVEQAQCGVEGIAKARKLVPDLIILDLMMPDMSGIEVVEQIEADHHLPQIPILFCTANRYARIENVRGVADICYKPFDIDQILDCICALVASENRIEGSTLVVDVDENDPLHLEHQQLITRYDDSCEALEALKSEGYEIIERPNKQQPQ